MKILLIIIVCILAALLTWYLQARIDNDIVFGLLVFAEFLIVAYLALKLPE